MLWRVGAVGLVASLVLVVSGLTARSVAPVRLALPPAGQVAADFMRGIPVFVVHDVDGVTAVLDAFNPNVYPEHDFFPLLAWCDESGLFEDLWFHSRFSPEGEYLGGPAPTGMSGYEILEITGDAIVVGASQAAPARPPEPLEIYQSADCAPRTANTLVVFEPGSVEIDQAVLDDLVFHSPLPDAPSQWWFVTVDRVLGKVRVVPDTWPTD